MNRFQGATHGNIFSRCLHSCWIVSSSFPCLMSLLTDRSCLIPSRSAIHKLLALAWYLIKLPIATLPARNAVPKTPSAFRRLTTAVRKTPRAFSWLTNAIRVNPIAFHQLTNAVRKIPRALCQLTNAVWEIPSAFRRLTIDVRKIPNAFRRLTIDVRKIPNAICAKKTFFPDFYLSSPGDF
jgi:hypothetical protein